jgi:hypothetical protein
MLDTLLHRGNQNGQKTTFAPSRPTKALAPRMNLRFNLKKMAYMLVAAFKKDSGGRTFRTISSGTPLWR